MKEPDDKPPDTGTPFDKFKALLGKLVRVPKKEVDRKEVEYQLERARLRNEKNGGK
jgi:hypothetical protein